MIGVLTIILFPNSENSSNFYVAIYLKTRSTLDISAHNQGYCGGHRLQVKNPLDPYSQYCLLAPHLGVLLALAVQVKAGWGPGRGVGDITHCSSC